MRIVKAKDIKAAVGYSPHWCIKLEKRGEFPRRVRLGPHSVGWLASEVDQWLASRTRVGDEAGA